jgi:hypothetical protein
MPQVFDYDSFYEDLYDSLVEEFLDSLLNGDIDLDDLPPDSDLAIEIKPDVDFINSKLPVLEDAREDFYDLVQELEQLLISMEQKAVQINFPALINQVNGVRVATGNDPEDNDIPFFEDLDDLAEDLLANYEPPKFTLAQLLAQARTYATIVDLENKLTTAVTHLPLPGTFTTKIHFSDISTGKTIADSKTGHNKFSIDPYPAPNWLVETPIREISINADQSLTEGVFDYAYELTNSINTQQYRDNDYAAVTKQTTEFDYVKEKIRIEALALYNGLLVCEDMQGAGVNRDEIYKQYTTQLIFRFNQTLPYSQNTNRVSKADWLRNAENNLYNFGTVMIEGNKLLIREVYKSHYQKLRLVGISAGYL